jgi:hypothetical protein
MGSTKGGSSRQAAGLSREEAILEKGLSGSPTARQSRPADGSQLPRPTGVGCGWGSPVDVRSSNVLSGRGHVMATIEKAATM